MNGAKVGILFVPCNNTASLYYFASRPPPGAKNLYIFYAESDDFKEGGWNYEKLSYFSEPGDVPTFSAYGSMAAFVCWEMEGYSNDELLTAQRILLEIADRALAYFEAQEKGEAD